MTANVQISTKRPNGNIYVIGGENFDDFYQNALAVYGGSTGHVDAIVEDVQLALMPNTDQAFAAATHVAEQAVHAAPTPPARTAPTPPASRPAAGGPPPGQQAPTCEHGYPREWKSGTSKAGKPYKMWSCPLDRDSGQCDPVWVR